jgi:hypothetical protein
MVEQVAGFFNETDGKFWLKPEHQLDRAKYEAEQAAKKELTDPTQDA